MEKQLKDDGLRQARKDKQESRHGKRRSNLQATKERGMSLVRCRRQTEPMLHSVVSTVEAGMCAPSCVVDENWEDDGN